MKSQGSIDVVICTYNNARMLDATLDALSRQRIPTSLDWQVLVVNNNCSDETPIVVEKHLHSAQLPLRAVIETRQGLTPARLRGVNETSREWIAFVDDDCLLEENWIEQALLFAGQRDQCGAFGGQILPRWEVDPPSYLRNRRYAFASKYHGDTAHRRPWIAGAGLVVRRQALVNCGWIDRQYLEDRKGGRLISGGDMEIALRVGSMYELWYNPACKLHHVIPKRRMSREYVRGVTRGLGASRHNAEALKWTGSYATWMPYSAMFALGFGVRSVFEFAQDAFQSGIDLKMAFSPALGWCSAMWDMFRMDACARSEMLGCATNKERREDPIPLQEERCG